MRKNTSAFIGETKIATDMGVYPISELAEMGTKFKVLNFDLKWCTAHAIKAWRSPEKLIKVTFKNKRFVYCGKSQRWPYFRADTLRRDVLYTGRRRVKRVRKTKDLNIAKQRIYMFPGAHPIFNKDSTATREDGYEAGSKARDQEFPDILWRTNHEFVSGYVDYVVQAYANLWATEELKYSALEIRATDGDFVTNLHKLFTLYGIYAIRGLGTGSKDGLGIEGTALQNFGRVFTLSSVMQAHELDKVMKLKPGARALAKNSLRIMSVEDTDLVEDTYSIVTTDHSKTFLMETGLASN